MYDARTLSRHEMSPDIEVSAAATANEYPVLTAMLYCFPSLFAVKA